MLSDGAKTCGCGAGHSTFGSCLRAKRLRLTGCGVNGSDRTATKRWDAELDLYRSAIAQGIEPASTRTPQIMDAIKMSETVGEAYDATDHTFGGKIYIPETKELV